MDRMTDAAILAVEGTHMRDAAHRAIAGFSMGGYGVMNIAMQNRGVFGQVVRPGADAMTARCGRRSRL